MVHVLTAFLLVASLQDPPEVQKAMKTLEKRPDDSSANLIMAAYRSENGTWEEVVPHLEKVKNSSIKSALEAELKNDKASLTAVEIGDMWSKAMPRAGYGRQMCFDRMNFHYARAYPDLDDLWRVKLKERLYRLYFPARPGKAMEGRPQGWGGITNQDCGVEITNKIAHDGGSSLKLYAKKPGANIFLQTPSVHVSKGQKVEVSAWVMSDGTEGAGDNLTFLISGSAGKRIWTYNDAIHPDMPVWTRIHAEVEAPEESFAAHLDIRITSSKGAVYIDGISIKVNGREELVAGID